jgi:hypothetical protein
MEILEVIRSRTLFSISQQSQGASITECLVQIVCLFRVLAQGFLKILLSSTRTLSAAGASEFHANFIRLSRCAYSRCKIGVDPVEMVLLFALFISMIGWARIRNHLFSII